MKWPLLPLLLFPWPSWAQEVCDTPLALPEILGVLEASPALILGFEQSRAGDQLDVLQAKLPCLNEAMDTWMLSRTYYLRGMAALYQEDAEGREPEGSHQQAISWFVLAQATHPAMDWDLATFGPYGQADFSAARARLTYCGGQPATCFVSVTLPEEHRRLMVDGRWVPEGTTSISLLPGRHLVQHSEGDRWYGQWIEVPEQGGVQLTLPGPAEPTSPSPHTGSELQVGGQVTMVNLPYTFTGPEVLVKWHKQSLYARASLGIVAGPLGTCEDCLTPQNLGLFVPAGAGVGLSLDTGPLRLEAGAGWRTTFGGGFGTRQEVVDGEVATSTSAALVELGLGLPVAGQRLVVGGFAGVGLLPESLRGPVWGLSVGLLHPLGGE